MCDCLTKQPEHGLRPINELRDLIRLLATANENHGFSIAQFYYDVDNMPVDYRPRLRINIKNYEARIAEILADCENT